MQMSQAFAGGMAVYFRKRSKGALAMKLELDIRLHEIAKPYERRFVIQPHIYIDRFIVKARVGSLEFLNHLNTGHSQGKFSLHLSEYALVGSFLVAIDHALNVIVPPEFSAEAKHRDACHS